MDYVMRPVQVRAVRYTGANSMALLELCGFAVHLQTGAEPVNFYLRNDQGEVVVCPGHWLVRIDVLVVPHYFAVPDSPLRHHGSPQMGSRATGTACREPLVE